MTYQPHYISAFDEDSGLQTYNDPFLLPEKAFPILENAYVWRNKVKKRDGFTHLARLRRRLLVASLGNTLASPWTFNIYATLVPPIVGEPNAEIEPASVTITIAGILPFIDNGLGQLISLTPANSGTINYETGVVVLTHTAGLAVATTITFAYFPCLPCMGLRLKENDIINEEDLVAFDTKYAYIYIGTEFQELPSTTLTTWTGNDYEFFWTTNYFRDTRTPDPLNPSYGNNAKLFWATNFSTVTPDPIRFYNGVTWSNFRPYLAADGLTTAPSHPSKIGRAHV